MGLWDPRENKDVSYDLLGMNFNLLNGVPYEELKASRKSINAKVYHFNNFYICLFQIGFVLNGLLFVMCFLIHYTP